MTYKDYEIVDDEFARENGKKMGDCLTMAEDHAHPLVLNRKIKPKDDVQQASDSFINETYKEEVDPQGANYSHEKSMNTNLKSDIEDAVRKSVMNHFAPQQAPKSPVNAQSPAQAGPPAIANLGELLSTMVRAKKWNNQIAQERLVKHEQLAVKKFPGLVTKAPLGAFEFGSGGDEAGGFSVFPEFIDQVFHIQKDYPDLLSQTVVFPANKTSTINFPTLNEPSLRNGQRHGGVQAFYQSAEGNALTSSYPSLLQRQLILKSLFILTYGSLQLLEDSTIGFEKYTSEQSALELLWQLDAGIISGTGGAEPLGILNQPSLITVPKISGQTQTVNFQNITAMYNALWPPARRRAVWLANPDQWNSLLQMSFPNESGTFPAMSMNYDVRDAVYPLKLLGRPVIECLMMPDAGLEGSLILADMSAIYTAVHQPLVRVDVSNEFQFATAQVAFRWTCRWDANSPWNTTITSNSGCSTYGPFVALGQTGSSSACA